MIHMQCVVIIAGLDRFLIADWAPDSKRLPEACDENKKLVAVFLHLQRLPLDDRGHCPLDARLVTNDTVELPPSAVAQRREQHEMGRDEQGGEGDQPNPAAFLPLAGELTDEDHAG